ncbi:hypothetical protein [Alteriqipengyuania lutimaris]|uniref:Uncharacterized protein n=1 Tax=Alteriqipengyuania lutimaris TaxID=1538146 RepID=A0A395LK06_9SPHN|nr:hypothetical protein [Alteriqipengyuania lutimaris]MBB3034036.1 hypothetical protein [Alteriqipengyuania lutimaris]RDS77019.1 hypothetical protein DL238_04940 [Alteriqipengyuania lutimaris]
MIGMDYLALANDADFDAALAGGCDLRDELLGLATSQPMSAAGMQRLFELGVAPRIFGVLHGAGDLAVARVAITSPARGPMLWEPEGTEPRLLVGVREQGVLVDIVSLSTENPDSWALRRGAAWCLGHEAFERCDPAVHWDHAQRLRIQATPIDWMRSGGEGICVLDWSVAPHHLRSLGEDVQLCCDRGAGAALRGLLRFGGVPGVREIGPIRPANERRAA